MGEDDRAGDGEAEAGAGDGGQAGVGRAEELVEDAVEQVGRDAGAAVLDGDVEAAAGEGGGGDGDGGAGRGVLGGVLEQVGQDALELGGVGPEGREVVGDVDGDGVVGEEAADAVEAAGDQ